jgi:hypothetical protein
MAVWSIIYTTGVPCRQCIRTLHFGRKNWRAETVSKVCCRRDDIIKPDLQETSEGPFSTQEQTFGFHKMRWSSRVTDRLLAQVGTKCDSNRSTVDNLMMNDDMDNGHAYCKSTKSGSDNRSGREAEDAYGLDNSNTGTAGLNPVCDT